MSIAPVRAQLALPSLSEALQSRTDIWGEAALRQTNGPSYEFFEKLLPPLRYVNADFHFYPLVLSAPNAAVKARLISNGSGVNLKAGARSWKEIGTPVIFRVGTDELKFGQIPSRLEEPVLADGYLPIPQIRYQHCSEVYQVEAFAATEPELAEHAVVFVRFSLVEGTNGNVSIQIDSPDHNFDHGQVTNHLAQSVVWFDEAWAWGQDRARARIGQGKSAVICICTVPFDSKAPSPLEHGGYDRHRAECVQVWNKVLEQSMKVDVPEARVNNAWRNLIMQNFSLIQSNRILYSAGNQYEALYESEGSDAAIAMLLWGFEADTRRLLGPLLDFTRQAILFNQAGHKLEDVALYYWQTRDFAALKALRPKWQREVERILHARGDNGLLPREHYCNDIPTPVFSLNSNGKCWRGLRDVAAVLQEIGEVNEGRKLAEAAADFRKVILRAVERSTYTNTEPAFVPVALFGEEPPTDLLYSTRLGSYWNLMANFVLGFEILGQGSHGETATLEYIQRHGGLCLGMGRFRPQPGFWISADNVDPLYGMRYVLTLFRRDEPDQALVSFYGFLAQGLTRNTFIAGEGSSLVPLDGRGRQFYCPPNSAGNAHFLQMLRYLLIQDWDLDDDGKPDTLRLCFATPKRWLENGKIIKVERAPTAFGPISFRLESNLAHGEILAQIDLPRRNTPKRILLRARVPEGWKVLSAESAGAMLPLDKDGTADLSSLSGKVNVHFAIAHS